jgi:hypothetical protein
MIKLGCESQFVNYVHGKFESTGDLWQDLKLLQAERCFISVECVGLDDIRTIMVGIVKMMGGFDHQSSIDDFMEDISPKKYYRWAWDGLQYMNAPHPDYDYDKAVIHKCMSIIRLTKVRERGKDGMWYWLFDIEAPNYEILPKKEKK